MMKRLINNISNLVDSMLARSSKKESNKFVKLLINL